MARLPNAAGESILQLTCVYGELTPKLIEAISPTPLHITDVAMVQLELAKSKAPCENALLAALMNAEHPAYRDDSFSTVVLFLLHEMPEEARVKKAVVESDERIFADFYRVTEFRIASLGP